MTKPDIHALRATMQAVHDSGANLSLDWRLDQLKRLRRMLLEYWDDFLDTLDNDLGKNHVESTISELRLVLAEVDFAIRHVRHWIKPEKVAAPMALFPSSHRIEKRPLLGPACLIIGPFNYPVQLTLLPIIGALAAGNPVILKPSELTPQTSATLEKALHKHFDASVVRVLNGGVTLTTELLQLPWGKIFFTGSERVGRIVAVAAAQTLTPVVLELGGKSPVIVDETAPWDMQTVANRIAWAKFFNAGQSCIAPDYVLVHESKVEILLDCLIRTTEWQYGTNHRESELGRIVSPTHAKRLQGMIQEVEQDNETRVIVGRSADCDTADRYVCPTIIYNPPMQARLWEEEIFGPILPIRSFSTRQQAVDLVRSRPGTPLATYVFTSKEAVLQEYIRDIRTGSVFRNDVMVHNGLATLPFGGIGTSGIGNYHGKFSFDTFSQALSVSYRPALPGTDFGMARYHPYQGIKGWLLVNVLLKLPYIPVIPGRVIAVSVVLMGLYACQTPDRLLNLSSSIQEILASRRPRNPDNTKK